MSFFCFVGREEVSRRAGGLAVRGVPWVEPPPPNCFQFAIGYVLIRMTYSGNPCRVNLGRDLKVTDGVHEGLYTPLRGSR